MLNIVKRGNCLVFNEKSFIPIGTFRTFKNEALKTISLSLPDKEYIVLKIGEFTIEGENLNLNESFDYFVNNSIIQNNNSVIENPNGNVDLSNYYTKPQIDSKLVGYITTSELNDVKNLIPNEEFIIELIENNSPYIDGLATEEYVDGKISEIPQVDLSNYYSKNETNDLIETKAEVDHKHNANDIIETPEKTFIDNTKKTQIDSNTEDISNNLNKIIAIESKIEGLSTSDEKVKMNGSSDSKFLEELIDPRTLMNVNGVLKVINIDGLVATIHEINQLQGVTSNIQAQINALNSLGNFTTSVDTHSELLSIVDMEANDMVIVLNDESQIDETTSIYIYNGNEWIFSGVFKGGEVRDFTINPIKLETEVDGVLPKTKYEKQTAQETNISNTLNNFKSNNVEDALNELFTYANNIKTSVVNVIGSPLVSTDSTTQLVDKINQLKNNLASAITEKGVVTYPYVSLNEIINKVNLIPSLSVESDVKQTGLQTKSVNQTIEVYLTQNIPLDSFSTTLIEYVTGQQNINHINETFNSNDNYIDGDFEDIVFDGSLKIKTDYPQTLEEFEVDGTFVKFNTIINEDIVKIKF